jgi:TolC family type I secretion outer membrane protein
MRCVVVSFSTGTVEGARDASLREDRRRVLTIQSLGHASRRGRLTALALLVVGALAMPAEASDSLDEALISAYLSNPQLESGRAVLRATDELVPQALARGRPSVFVDGTVDALTQDTDNSERDDRLSQGVNLSVRQPLYAGGGIRAGVRQAENQVRAERAFLLATEQQVLLDAVDAYTATWRDRVVLDLAITNETRIARELQATRDRFEVGEVARTDVAQSEARLARARADIETARADLAASTAAFRDIIGIDPGVLAEPQAFPILPTSESEAQAMAAANPNITSATFELQAAREAVDVAFADLLPSLDLTGDLNYQNEPARDIDRRDEARVGLQLSVPLFQGGADRSRVRQNRQTVDARRSDLENTLRGVQRAVTTSWERVIAARAAVRSFEEEVRANQIALDGVREESLVGQRTVLDVLNAEQELFTSQTSLVSAQREAVLATYQLKSAIGELTVSGLDLDVQPYDADAYYLRNRDRLFGLD